MSGDRIIAVVLVAVVAMVIAVVLWRGDDQPALRGRGLEPELEVAEAMIGYDEMPAAAFSIAMSPGHDLAVDAQGRVAVAGGDGVRVFASDGRTLRHLLAGETAFAVAWGDDGERLYIATQQRLMAFADADSPLWTWQPPRERAFLLSIACAGDDVFVSDNGDHPRGLIWHLDRDGALRGHLGAAQADYEGLKVATVDPRHFLALALLPDGGDLIVANQGRLRLERFARDGGLQGVIGGPAGRRSFEDHAAFVGCCNPIALAVLDDGGVVTAEKGSRFARVKIIEVDGSLRCYVAPPAAFAGRKLGPMALAVDGAGRILLIDERQWTVRVFAPRTRSRP